MSTISDALRASMATATAFTASLFADGAWDSVQIAAFVNDERNITIATTSAVGHPARRSCHRRLGQGRHLLHRPRPVRDGPQPPQQRPPRLQRCRWSPRRDGTRPEPSRSAPASKPQRSLTSWPLRATPVLYTPPGWSRKPFYRINIRRIFAS